MTTRERLVAIIDESGGMLRHCDERTSKALKSFYNALFMLADSIDGKTEEIRGNQEKISPNFKIEKGKMYRCIHSIDTFEKDHIYQSYEDGWIKNDDDNHVIAYSKYFCPVSEEKPESVFAAAIQPGDKIVFNKDMGCRVNLSQLNRVAKKQGEQKLLYVNDNAKEMFIKALECVEEQNNKGYKLTDCDKNSWWEDFKAYTSCIIEQKPAWSEEDEKMIGNIRRIIEQYAFSNSAVDVNGELCEKEYIDADNFLKSLKERYTWRPSDEQMRAIEHICDGNYNVDLDILDSIYRDFKKLRK